MKILKKMFKNYMLVSLICIALGIALVIEPEILTRTISYVLGGAAILWGVFKAIYYFTREDEKKFVADVISAVIFVAVGIFLILKPDFIPKVISVCFGVYMLVNGIISMTTAVDIKHEDDDEWKFPAASAVITAIVGFVIILNPLMPIKFAMTILGIALIISGASNLFGCFTAKSKLKHLKKAVAQEKQHNDDTFIDI